MPDFSTSAPFSFTSLSAAPRPTRSPDHDALATRAQQKTPQEPRRRPPQRHADTPPGLMAPRSQAIHRLPREMADRVVRHLCPPDLARLAKASSLTRDWVEPTLAGGFVEGVTTLAGFNHAAVRIHHLPEDDRPRLLFVLRQRMDALPADAPTRRRAGDAFASVVSHLRDDADADDPRRRTVLKSMAEAVRADRGQLLVHSDPLLALGHGETAMALFQWHNLSLEALADLELLELTRGAPVIGGDGVVRTRGDVSAALQRIAIEAPARRSRLLTGLQARLSQLVMPQQKEAASLEWYAHALQLTEEERAHHPLLPALMQDWRQWGDRLNQPPDLAVLHECVPAASVARWQRMAHPDQVVLEGLALQRLGQAWQSARQTGTPNRRRLAAVLGIETGPGRQTLRAALWVWRQLGGQVDFQGAADQAVRRGVPAALAMRMHALPQQAQAELEGIALDRLPCVMDQVQTRSGKAADLQAVNDLLGIESEPGLQVLRERHRLLLEPAPPDGG